MFTFQTAHKNFTSTSSSTYLRVVSFQEKKKANDFALFDQMETERMLKQNELDNLVLFPASKNYELSGESQLNRVELNNDSIPHFTDMRFEASEDSFSLEDFMLKKDLTKNLELDLSDEVKFHLKKQVEELEEIKNRLKFYVEEIELFTGKH